MAERDKQEKSVPEASGTAVGIGVVAATVVLLLVLLLKPEGLFGHHVRKKV